MIKSREEYFDRVWKPVKSVIEHLNMSYGDAVTIGGQFGELKREIKRLDKLVSRKG